jgi:conjugation system TraG family ATPase
MKIDLNANFPIVTVEGGISALVSRNGDVTVCYEAVFANLNTLSADDFDSIHENFRNAFSHLPENTLLHAQTFFSNAAYDNTKLDLQSSQESFLGESNESLLLERIFKQTKSYLFFTLCNTRHSSKKGLHENSIFSPVSFSKKDFEPERAQLFLDGVENYLRAIKGKDNKLDFQFQKIDSNRLMGSRGYLTFCEQYLMLTQDRQDYISEIYYDTEERTLRIGDKRCGIFNIDSADAIGDTIPSFTQDPKLSTEVSFFPASLCKDFTHKIDGEMVYNVVIFKEDAEAIKKELRDLVNAKRSILSYSEENARSLADTEAYLKNIVEGAGRLFPVRFYANVIYWTEDSFDKFKELKSSIHEGFKSKGLIPSISDSESLLVFLNTMPGNVGNIGADQMILSYSEVAGCFLNYEETFPHENNVATGFAMLNRNGARVILDIFGESGNSKQRKAITGYNFFCLGPTGSGKSVTMNTIIRTAIEQGAFVMVVDVGHSYKNLCKYYFRGSYFSFEPGEPVRINPFKIDGYMPGERRIDMILKMLLKAWKGEGLCEKLDENILLSSIQLYYQYLEYEHQVCGNFIEQKFDTYYEYMKGNFKEEELPNLNTSNKFDLAHFLDVMRIFYKGGIYDQVLNANYNIDLRRERFIVFELDNIKGNKVLFPLIVVYMIGTFEEILKEGDGDGVRKYLIIEEAWKAIMNDMFAGYIQEMYKTSRKFKGSIGLVTQELNDIIGNEIIKDTVITQSEIKFVLSMAKYMNKMEGISTALSLEGKHIAMILSMNRDLKPTDKHRELFIHWNNELYGVYGLSLSAKEYWTYTTEAPERDLVKYLMKMEFNNDIFKTLNFLDQLSREHNYQYYKVIEHCNRIYNHQLKMKSNPLLLR